MTRLIRNLIPAFLFVACSDTPAPEQKPAPPKALAAAGSQPASAPAAPKTVATGPRILAMEGQVSVDGKPAVVGSPVTPTSMIETGAKSWARITLEPKSVFAVRADTRFALGTSPRKKWSVALAVGALWSFLPKGSSYEVVTNNAVAGVRGTTLYVSTTAAGQTGVCDCDGEVELMVGAKKRTVHSKHQHVGAMISGADKKAKLGAQKKSKKPPGHDDVEAGELEKLRQTIAQ